MKIIILYKNHEYLGAFICIHKNGRESNNLKMKYMLSEIINKK